MLSDVKSESIARLFYRSLPKSIWQQDCRHHRLMILILYTHKKTRMRVVVCTKLKPQNDECLKHFLQSNSVNQKVNTDRLQFVFDSLAS